MGTAALRKIQYVKEVTHGTAIAATKILPVAVPAIKPDRKPTYPRENVGVLADAVRSYVSGRIVRDSLKWSTAYYQILPMLFSCGIKGNVTASEQTAGQGDYLWDFGPAFDGTSNAQDSLTIERGDNDWEAETEYCMFDSIKISGECNQDGGDSSAKIEASYFGRQNTVSAFTAGLTIPALTPINSKLTKFFLDTSWAGVGGTEKASTLRAYEVEILTGLHPKFFGSAVDYFDSHGEGPMAIMASFTFEGDATIVPAMLTAMNASTLQVIRLQTLGPKIGTTKTYELTIDISGTWESVIPLAEESNGNNLWTAVLHGFYDPTGAKMFDLQVCTNANTI